MRSYSYTNFYSGAVPKQTFPDSYMHAAKWISYTNPLLRTDFTRRTNPFTMNRCRLLNAAHRPIDYGQVQMICARGKVRTETYFAIPFGDVVIKGVPKITQYASKTL